MRSAAVTKEREVLSQLERDEIMVADLRKWQMEGKAGVRRTIEEIVEECETDLMCRVVTANSVQEGLVVRVEDGTCSKVLSMEYRGQDTMTQEEAGNNKHFIDVWVENSSLVENIRQLDMVAGEWVRMEKVKCVKEGAGGSDIFRFSVVDGKIKRLKRMLGVEESQTGSGT